MQAWVHAGVRLAERFPGFLGAGRVRPGDSSPDLHMLYRFATAADLGRWEDSRELAPVTAQWLLVLRVLFMTLLLTPLMTYLVLPAMTRALRRWLEPPARA